MVRTNKMHDHFGEMVLACDTFALLYVVNNHLCSLGIRHILERISASLVLNKTVRMYHLAYIVV